MKKIAFFSSFLLFAFCLGLNGQTIQEIQGTGDASPYVNQEVTTTGVVTAFNETGYFIQDGTALRSGIYVYDQDFTPSYGQEVSITATVAEFYTLTELKDVTNLTVIAPNADVPQPLELTTTEINNEDYEGMLVTVTGICTNNNLGFNEWELNDGSGPCRIDDFFYLFSAQEGVSYQVTGPATYTFDNYKIFPRSEFDIVIDLPLYFTLAPKESDLTTSGFTVRWETNIPANTRLEYGKTPAFELGLLSDDTEVTQHEVNLSGLEAGTMYYVRPYSEANGEVTPTRTYVMATVSNSSGEIKVYFNHPVNTSVASISEAAWTPNIVDTIINYLDRAESTLDITMYEAQNDEIVQAINAAYDRGVQVRVISDDEGDNVAFDNLNANIPLLEGNSNGIMHNKFILIDADEVDNAWVMTGSMNHTVANLGWDYNNIICLQDQSLARAYRLEFEEMWGSTDAQPNAGMALFSDAKTDNTPHHFLINDIPVELYFSPTEPVASRVQEAIDAAESELAFAILVFTENSLGTAVRNAKDRGVTTQGIIDYVEFNGSEFDFLVNNEVEVIDYQNADGSQWPDGPTLHHKYAIIDYLTGDDPLTITGSYNWTASAGSIHDENLLFIYDEEISNWYYQEFHARYFGIIDAVLEIPNKRLELYPNPTNGVVQLVLEENGLLEIYDQQGRLVKAHSYAAGTQTITFDEPTGVYYFYFRGDNEIFGARVVRQ